MSTSSRYIRLSSSVLLEYIYTDQLSPETHSVTSYPWYKMHDGHTNEDYIFNSDAMETLTGNVRDRSAAVIDKSTGKYASLDIDKIVAYNDVDPLMTSTVNLPIGFTGAIGNNVTYDTIRLHMTQGFNFEQNEGFIFEIDVIGNDGRKIKIVSTLYRPQDNFAVVNPNPFLLGGKSYNSYIELKIPALYYLQMDYYNQYVQSGNSDILPFKISGGFGFETTRGIEVGFGWVEHSERILNQDYYYVYSKSFVSLNRLDSFAQVSAYIGEATDGDYIELYAKYKNDIIEDYILDLNNSPNNDYMILHDIELYEQIPIGATSTFIKTQTLQLAQSSDYDQPIKYRPIIQNSNIAISYKIMYVVRLFNRIDNSQLWKTASFISFDVAKYGKRLTKINLGDNPIQTKIYNQIVSKTVNITENPYDLLAINGDKRYANYVTSFIENQSINISATTIYSGQKDTQPSDINEIFPQGMAKIHISPFDTFIKFKIYQESKNVNTDSNLTFVDLNGVGNLRLSFTSNSGESVMVEETKDGTYQKSQGEVIFKIPKNIANQILGFNNRNFYITAKNDSSIESMIYTGTYLSNSEYKSMVQKNTIKGLNNTIADLKTQVKTLSTSSKANNAVIDEQQRIIEDLGAANDSLNKLLESQIKVNQESLSLLLKQKAKYEKLDDVEEVKNTDEDIKTLQTKIDSYKNTVKIPVKKGEIKERFTLTSNQKEREATIKLSANINTSSQSPYTDDLNLNKKNK